MHPAARAFVFWATGNKIAQDAIRWTMIRCQSAMGIGSSALPDASGESGVFRELLRTRRSDNPLCVFDVGANKGQFAALAGKALAGVPHTIHAFEPSLTTFNELKANVANRADIIANNFALAEAPGTRTLHYNVPGSGLASLTRRDLTHLGTTFDLSEKVNVDTVDRYCERAGVEHIDLLKMDVEGHELDVLMGATGMLRTERVGILTCEFGGCNIDTRTFMRDVFDCLRAAGMNNVFRITPSGYLYPLGRYKEEYEQFRTSNLAAYR